MKRRILIALAGVIGAGVLTAGAPMLAAEVENPVVELAAGVEPAAAAGFWVRCNSTSGTPYVSAEAWSSSTISSAAINCFVKLGERRWGYGCASVPAVWTDPITQVRYGTVYRKQGCGAASVSFSARGQLTVHL